MAIKNVYLNDDENNELHPYINAVNILDPDNLTNDCAKKTDTLNINAGYIKNGGNLDEFTDTGIYNIQGADGTTIKNLPAGYADSNLWASVICLNGAGLRQIYIQGGSMYIRAKMGNPATFESWKQFNYTVLQNLQDQISFLAKQLGGNK
ncbi:pyocin knob domain-containing protein [Fructilactobacillus sp. Tb1]|uniref:pyocin knob domain-containing protein n=1 Tax=Fructilactobacillus sp. Tb1 TaxID=3422304 RepID=UPI003D2B74E6